MEDLGETGYKFYEANQVKEVYFGLKTDMETKAIVLSLLNYLPKNTPMIDKKGTIGTIL